LVGELEEHSLRIEATRFLQMSDMSDAPQSSPSECPHYGDENCISYVWSVESFDELAKRALWYMTDLTVSSKTAIFILLSRKKVVKMWLSQGLKTHKLIGRDEPQFQQTLQQILDRSEDFCEYLDTLNPKPSNASMELSPLPVSDTQK